MGFFFCFFFFCSPHTWAYSETIEFTIVSGVRCACMEARHLEVGGGGGELGSCDIIVNARGKSYILAKRRCLYGTVNT